MENLLSASVDISLDGQVYKLRYRAYAFIVYAETVKRDLLADLNGLSAALNNVGKRLTELGATAPEGAAAPDASVMGAMFATLRDVLWAGLVDLQPDLTRDRIARMFGFHDLSRLAPLIVEAMNATMGPQTAAPARPTTAANSHDLALIGGVDSGRISGMVRE